MYKSRSRGIKQFELRVRISICIRKGRHLVLVIEIPPLFRRTVHRLSTSAMCLT